MLRLYGKGSCTSPDFSHPFRSLDFSVSPCPGPQHARFSRGGVGVSVVGFASLYGRQRLYRQKDTLLGRRTQAAIVTPAAMLARLRVELAAGDSLGHVLNFPAGCF